MSSKASQEQNNKQEVTTEQESDEFVTIKIPRIFLKEWEELANRFGMPLEELIQSSLGEILSRHQADANQAANYLLEKNAELYKRLA